MIVLIINYNRLTLPSKMADWLSKRGCEPVIIDNNSDYPPLLKYYKTTPYKVIRMGSNFGHTVIWERDVLGMLGITGNYIVTDPDLDLSCIPDDFPSVLEEGLRRYPQYDKCGFSLEINDISNPIIFEWEKQFWQKPIDDVYFYADIDTTFALYKPGYNMARYGENSHGLSLRTNRPYTARHIPWLYNRYEELPKEEKYYFDTSNNSYSGKGRYL